VRAAATNEQCQHHHHRGMAESEPEPDRFRPVAVGGQLAGDVVDGGDVVYVECVTQAEDVGGDPQADREDLCPNLIVRRCHGEDESSEADCVQDGDCGE